ncbi:MAG: hypothetical protein ABSA62_14425 [Methyloceanibacter sp.]|jgi:hypothetical protein
MTLIYIASPKGCIEGKDYDHWEYRDEKLGPSFRAMGKRFLHAFFGAAIIALGLVWRAHF